MKLKLAILSAHSCPVGTLGAKDTGGMSVYIKELARELGKQGFFVDIYTRVHDPKDPQIIELGKNARLIHLRAGEEKSIHKLEVYSYLPEFVGNLESFRKCNSLRYDLIFSHYWLSGWAGEYLQDRWNVPHLAMFHTLGAVKNAIGIGEDEPRLRLKIERRLVKNCHHIIAATEKEKEVLIFYYDALPEKISVIPCGVNLNLFQPINKETAKERLGFGENKIILFVGRVDPLKGIDRLLKAMTYLQNNQKMKLVIIGGDERSQDEIERLQRLAQYLHLDGSVNFLGSVKQEELSYFYSAADVCVVPSYYESFGLVALESLACGTPVVATNVGNLKNIIRQGKTGYVVVNNNPHRLANKIALLLSRKNPDMKSAFSIRASITQFSWTNITHMIKYILYGEITNY